MPTPTLTRSQIDVDQVLFDIIDTQRTFESNTANRMPDLRLDTLFNITAATATGLVVGGLIGTILGMRRG